MTRSLFRNAQGAIDIDLRRSNLNDALECPDGLLWLDFSGEPVDEIELILTNIFHFHPLAVEDALRESHVPKINDWQDYLYIVLRAAKYPCHGSNELSLPELDIFLGPNYIVTCSQESILALDRVWEVCQQDQRLINHGASYLLYRLADELISESVLVVECMQDRLEQIEDQLFAEPSSGLLEDLFALKRNILQLRRIVGPQKDVLNKLSRYEYPVIATVNRIFFRDVSDHLLRLDSLLDDMIILVGGALDIYLSVVNNRMNDIMKTLTVITAFFMPLAFITGFFGMNFFVAAAPLQAWTGGIAFTLILVSMLVIPLIMFSWMRRRAWI